jgi:hypothetical protein
VRAGRSSLHAATNKLLQSNIGRIVLFIVYIGSIID